MSAKYIAGTTSLISSIFFFFVVPCRHGWEYFTDQFNWIDLLSSLLLSVVGLRWADRAEQWHVFSVGFLLWTLRIFKYAAVFSTFWYILFTGVRILIEGEPVVDYTGPDGYKPLSCILMVVFLFTCCMVLLNILIAQLSDTYQNVQRDAQRGLELNRAWIVARVELNGLFIGQMDKMLDILTQLNTAALRQSGTTPDVTPVTQERLPQNR